MPTTVFLSKHVRSAKARRGRPLFTAPGVINPEWSITSSTSLESIEEIIEVLVVRTTGPLVLHTMPLCSTTYYHDIVSMLSWPSSASTPVVLLVVDHAVNQV